MGFKHNVRQEAGTSLGARDMVTVLSSVPGSF